VADRPARAPVDGDSETLIAGDARPDDAPETTVTRSAAAAAASSVGHGGSARPRLAGRYEILALVGSGGMGTVYRARDTELDEIVALKVMRPELLATPGILERFRREAKLARRVTHRNVARVFDIGEHDNDRFLTMEFVEGESLAAALQREGALAVPRALAIAAAIAEGLGVAHDAGVVHRDLKPDNVMLAKDGRVVLTDFGIARAVFDVLPRAADAPASASDTLGLVVGTPAYMAPEQVDGGAEITARADIYAFGALLYEVVTGRRAWPGEAPLGVAAARLLAPPPDPRAARSDLPDPLAELILRCMARDPAGRPASMADVGAALRAPGITDSRVVAVPPSSGATRDPALTLGSPGLPPQSSPPTPRASAEKTVAVLPFRNTSDAADEYLAEELTDDLLDALSMTRGLRVRPRGAVMRYRGSDLDPRDIGRELGVQVVVEGSVRKARGQVRISARLVSVADGFQVWATRFDRPVEDVLSINDEAARAIAEALTLDGRAVADRVAPSDPVAIDLYLRARHEHRKWGPDSQRRAIELFDQALALVPDDALLLAGLASALARLSFFVGAEAIPRARQIAERAVAASPHLGEAQLALGSVLFQVGEEAGAARALRLAVKLGPGLSDAHAALGRLLSEVGAVDEGVRRLEASLALHQEAPLVLTDLARAHVLAGQVEQAESAMDRLAKLDPIAYWTVRARTSFWLRDPALVTSRLAAMPEGEQLRYANVLREVARTGELPSKLFDLEKEERTGSARRHTFVSQLGAEVLAFVGRHEEALAAVRSAVAHGLIDRLWLERCPLLDHVRAAPGFAAVHADVVRRTDAILEAYRAG
jgi:serine/threonine-protein kinase